MRTLLSWLGLAALVLAGLPAPAGAQPVGSEFQINTYTTNHQSTPTHGGKNVATDGSGNFVVVWHSQIQDGGTMGIFGQRYDSAGEAVGSEFRVNSYTPSYQYAPSVASDASGDFVVVWLSSDGSYEGVFGQRYDSSGVPQGGEFRVNSYTTRRQNFPAVASDASGNFVVVWFGNGQSDTYGIFGQRYDSAGGTLGGEFRVNSFTTNEQTDPSVASDASGNFVVVWESEGQDGSGYGIFGRRFNSLGGALGSEFRVNTYTNGNQASPSIATAADGDFVVTWLSYGQVYGTLTDVYGQRYNSSGQKLGGEFRVNFFTGDWQAQPSVVTDPSGSFVVAWNRSGLYCCSSDVFGRRFDSAGVAQGTDFQINSFTTSGQTYPSAAATGIDQFVVVWESYTQDGSGDGVFGQRFDFGAETPTLHVGDLDGRAKNTGRNWRAQVKTLMHDDTHGAESGVLVVFNVSAGVGVRTCTTTANGTCEVSASVTDAVQRLTFTVVDLTKTGFTYNPGVNHDPDPDSDGTVIVVNQP